VHRVAADRFERGFADKSQGSLGGDDLHVVPGKHEQPDNSDCFVSCDATGDADDDVEARIVVVTGASTAVQGSA
jgi:hypothetical protein